MNVTVTGPVDQPCALAPGRTRFWPTRRSSQIVLAHVQARQKQVDEAVAAYAAVVALPDTPEGGRGDALPDGGDPRHAAQDGDSEAHKLLPEIADLFPGHGFVPRVLLARGDRGAPQEPVRHGARQGRNGLAGNLPRPHRDPTRGREHALWRLGQAYERVECYDLAAQAYSDLGED
jgi:hypothetical protein